MSKDMTYCFGTHSSQFDNDLVRNQCIINQNVEQTVLIKDRQEGFAFMAPKNPPPGWRRPNNVKQTFVMHDMDPNKGFRIGFGAGGGDSSSPIQSWNGPSRMKTDSDYQLKYVLTRSPCSMLT